MMIPKIRRVVIINNDIVWDINLFIMAMCNSLSWTMKSETLVRYLFKKLQNFSVKERIIFNNSIQLSCIKVLA